MKKIYATCLAVNTRVNGCENKIGLVVYTDHPLTEKPIRKKVFNYLMKEYAIEGMYGMTINNELTRVYNVESLHPCDFTGPYRIRIE